VSWLPVKILDVRIFHRDGVCLVHVPAGGGEQVVDPNLISGFLSAVSKFGEEVEEAKVRKIDFEGKTIIYEHVGDIIFAVRISGGGEGEAGRFLDEVSSKLEGDVRERLKAWNGDASVFEPLKIKILEMLSEFEKKGGVDMAEKFRKIGDKLGELRDIPGIKAAALVSNRGFLIASTLPPGFDEKVVAAIPPSILRMGAEGLKEMKLGRPRNIFIEGERGVMVLADVGGRAVLMVVATSDANLGYIFLEMENTSKELEKIL